MFTNELTNQRTRRIAISPGVRNKNTPARLPEKNYTTITKRKYWTSTENLDGDEVVSTSSRTFFISSLIALLISLNNNIQYNRLWASATRQSAASTWYDGRRGLIFGEEPDQRAKVKVEPVDPLPLKREIHKRHSVGIAGELEVRPPSSDHQPLSLIYSFVSGVKK